MRTGTGLNSATRERHAQKVWHCRTKLTKASKSACSEYNFGTTRCQWTANTIGILI